jgi:hypothetical protein
MFSIPGVQVCLAFLGSYILFVNPTIVGLLCHAWKDTIAGMSVLKLPVTAYTPLRSAFEEG